MEFTEGIRFDSLSLSPEIMRAIEKRGIEISTQTGKENSKAYRYGIFTYLDRYYD